MKHPWQDMLKAYFGLALSQGESDLWWDELYETVKGVTNDELCHAIRDASFRDRDRFSGKPELRTLRMWIYMRRKACDEYREPETSDCAMCDGSGVATVAPELPARGWGLRDWMTAYSASIPCMCSTGVEARGNRVPWREAPWSTRMDGLSRLAADQWRWTVEIGNGRR